MSEIGLIVARKKKHLTQPRDRQTGRVQGIMVVKKACNQKTMLCATDRILKTHLSLDRVLIDCEVTGGYVGRGGRGRSPQL